MGNYISAYPDKATKNMPSSGFTLLFKLLGFTLFCKLLSKRCLVNNMVKKNIIITSHIMQIQSFHLLVIYSKSLHVMLVQ